MKILILNWRDIDNPESGGAEVLTHEIAKRWTCNGHEVTQFSASFPGCRKEELKDGVKIIRRGSADIRSLALPVHLAAFLWYRRLPKGYFDAVIDEIHGIPFFTPLYVKEKKVALICEVANEIWKVAFSFPENIIGPIVEHLYFHFYKDIPFLTISSSTKNELIGMGIKEKEITILPMGLNTPNHVFDFKKEKDPTIVFVGRLTKTKGVEDALQVAANLKKTQSHIRLWVVGQGKTDYVQGLHSLVRELDIQENVKFFGFVNQTKKFEFMSRAHILIAPSMKEGWGLTVPEAGFVGTPAIGYDVEGLRDVIVHEKTGLLVNTTPEQMSRAVEKLLKDKKNYQKLQLGVRQLTQIYSWDKTAQVALSILEKA